MSVLFFAHKGVQSNKKTSGSQTVITKTPRIQVRRKTEGHIDDHHKDMKLIVAEKKGKEKCL